MNAPQHSELKAGVMLRLLDDEEILTGGDNSVIVKAGTLVEFVEYTSYEGVGGWWYHVCLPEDEANPEFHFDVPDFAVSKD